MQIKLSKMGKNIHKEVRTKKGGEQAPGNAGYALSILLKWAKRYPETIFRSIEI